MREMTITEGLVESKLLSSRIEKEINMSEWIWSVKTIDCTEESSVPYEDKAKAAYQSIRDLIEERNKIKSAIVKSNATTMVKVGKKEMTVAEAIERKSSIGYEQKLLMRWKTVYANAVNRVDTENVRVQNRIDQMLSQLVVNDKSDIAEAQKAVTETYIAQNGWMVYDPLNLEDKIKKLDEDIDDFLKNVDLALSLSNAVTHIEV